MQTRRRRISRFFRVVFAVTALTHVGFALAVRYAAAWAGLARPTTVGGAVALVLLAVFPFRATRLSPDRRRATWWIHVVEGPYFAHWCAALGALLPIALFALVDTAVSLVCRRTPGVPGAFAFWTYGTFLALALWGVYVRRRWVRVRTVEVALPELAPAFDGYRIVQLSDLHIGGLLPKHWAERWVRLANREKPDLIAVTGDLVASGNDFHHDIAQAIGELQAPDGVCVALGNHDYFGDAEALVGLLRERGALVLRNEGITVHRSGAKLYVAGADDTWTGRAHVGRALQGRRRASAAVLLAHDPALFAEAAAHGADLVLAGHTHGGQVAVPFLARSMSLGNLTHRHHLGLYREGRTAMYVHPGCGTTGPPIRLGVAPEVTVIVLRSEAAASARERPARLKRDRVPPPAVAVGDVPGTGPTEA